MVYKLRFKSKNAAQSTRSIGKIHKSSLNNSVFNQSQLSSHHHSSSLLKLKTDQGKKKGKNTLEGNEKGRRVALKEGKEEESHQVLMPSLSVILPFRIGNPCAFAPPDLHQFWIICHVGRKHN